MRAKEIFGLMVRIIGLAFLYQSLNAIPTAIQAVCPVFPHFYFKNLLASLVLVGWPALVSLWLIRGAPRLMRLAYPEPDPAREPTAPLGHP